MTVTEVMAWTDAIDRVDERRAETEFTEVDTPAGRD
jgi:hypothetical protein